MILRENDKKRRLRHELVLWSEAWCQEDFEAGDASCRERPFCDSVHSHGPSTPPPPVGAPRWQLHPLGAGARRDALPCYRGLSISSVYSQPFGTPSPFPFPKPVQARDPFPGAELLSRPSGPLTPRAPPGGFRQRSAGPQLWSAGMLPGPARAPSMQRDFRLREFSA